MFVLLLKDKRRSQYKLSTCKLKLCLYWSRKITWWLQPSTVSEDYYWNGFNPPAHIQIACEVGSHAVKKGNIILMCVLYLWWLNAKRAIWGIYSNSIYWLIAHMYVLVIRHCKHASSDQWSILPFFTPSQSHSKVKKVVRPNVSIWSLPSGSIPPQEIFENLVIWDWV